MACPGASRLGMACTGRRLRWRGALRRSRASDDIPLGTAMQVQALVLDLPSVAPPGTSAESVAGARGPVARRDSTAGCAHEFGEQGITHVDGLLLESHVRRLLDLAQSFREHGQLSPGQVGVKGVRPDRRTDLKRFIRTDFSEDIACLVRATDAVVFELWQAGAGALAARHGLLLPAPVARWVMVSCYEPGGFYRQHLDNPSGDDDNGRVLTCVFYLNDSWRCEDGGALRVLPRCSSAYALSTQFCEQPIDYIPLANRLVVFESATVAHEVLPLAQGLGRPRYALTVWYERAGYA